MMDLLTYALVPLQGAGHSILIIIKKESIFDIRLA